MDKNKNVSHNPDASTMLNQKTNEDFNQKKPHPTDPNEQKERPAVAPPIPDFKDDGLQPMDGETTDGSPSQQKPLNKSEGGE